MEGNKNYPKHPLKKKCIEEKREEQKQREKREPPETPAKIETKCIALNIRVKV